MHKIVSLALLFLFTTLIVFAQQPGKVELEKERATIQKEIENVKRSLNETKRNRKASITQFNEVQRKLELRQLEINVINRQLGLIQGNINHGLTEITILRKELDTLRLQYDKSVVYAYKTMDNYGFLNFVFSAGSFNDALRRVMYVRSFQKYRQEQFNHMISTQEQLHGKINILNQNKLQKSVVLHEEDIARRELENEKKEKDELIAKLAAREKELTRDIANKKKKDIKLSNAIILAISRTKTIVAKNTVVTKKNLLPNKNSEKVSLVPVKRSLKLTPTVSSETEAATIILSKKFEDNQHALPWPIESGKISMHFGLQKVPGYPIEYYNKFLTFETAAGKTVKVVFDGEVSMVTYIGSLQAVIVRHGKYFTTYNNLTDVSVKPGQQVKTGQALGTLAEKENNVGELDLGIFNDLNKSFDPEKWLRQRAVISY